MKKKFLLLNLILLQMVQAMEDEPRPKNYYSFVMNASTEIEFKSNENSKSFNFCNLLKRIGVIENDTKCSSGMRLLVQLWFNAGKND